MSDTSTRIRVLFATRDDLDDLPSGISDTLDVHTAFGPEEALGTCLRRAPHVVLLDESLLGDPDLVSQIRMVSPHAPVLAHLLRSGSDAVLPPPAGLDGHIRKGCSPAELVDAIRAAAQTPRPTGPPTTGDWAPQVLLHVLSDEILTPATVLQGVAQTFANQPGLTDHQRRDLAGSAQRASTRLRRLVENITLATDLSAGRVRIAPRSITVGELLSRLPRRFPNEPRLRFPHGSLSDEIRFDVDLDLATRALIAVVENALELSPSRQPVDIRVESAAGPVQIEVVDRGPGLPVDLGPKAFEPFVQGESGDIRTHRGMGIGLYLASSIMRLHGGRIDSETRPRGEHAMVLRFPLGCR